MMNGVCKESGGYGGTGNDTFSEPTDCFECQDYCFEMLSHCDGCFPYHPGGQCNCTYVEQSDTFPPTAEYCCWYSGMGECMYQCGALCMMGRMGFITGDRNVEGSSKGWKKGGRIKRYKRRRR